MLKLPFVDMLYIHASSIIILWVLLEGSMKQKILITIKGVFIIACCEEMIEAIIDIVITKFMYKSMSAEKEFIFANIVLLIIWPIIGMIKRKEIKLQRKYINALVMVALGIMAVVLALVIASTHYADPYVNNKKFSMMTDALAIISYFGIVILGLFIIYVRDTNESYKYLLEIESSLRKLQKSNYEVMLAKEEETREFRHDISNHVMCLQEMIRSGNMVEANKYIDQMQVGISKIQKRNYNTGNEILDAILNYYIQQLDEGIEVSVSGLYSCSLDMNNVELCSIISNPMQNVVEVLNKQIHGGRYLKIRMNNAKYYCRIEFCNSLSMDNITMINGLPRTIKKDKENHGIGLKTVKKLVEKHNGLFKVEIKENEFKVTLILPVRN